MHRAKILKAYAEESNGMLTLFFLPPYSPDLNPDEWVWKNVKHDNLGRASAKSEAELAAVRQCRPRQAEGTAGQSTRFFGDPALRYISDS